jgi:serine/threonine-protein kinase RIO1
VVILFVSFELLEADNLSLRVDAAVAILELDVEAILNFFQDLNLKIRDLNLNASNVAKNLLLYLQIHHIYNL